MAWVLPRFWSAGDAVTAAKMNEISASLHAVGATAWNTYTPVWNASPTPPTIGNGSIAGWYIVAGGWCEVEVIIVIGSTTDPGNGTYTISLPPGFPTLSPASVVMGPAVVFDTSTTGYNAHVAYRSAGGPTAVVLAADGGLRWTSAVPMTPANGDVISFKSRYRI